MKNKSEDSNAKKPNKKDQKIADLEQEVETLTGDLKRTQADFVNFKRRAEEDRASSIAFGAKQILLSLLPTLDNVHRALAHLPEDLQNNDWAQGVSKVAQQLEKELQNLGVEKIGVEDELFNPEYHEAVAVEGDGETEFVKEVLQTGYSLNGEVVRHAMVKVINK
ncbi:TPA: nucleotide exchange factor GrpE [Candidatus Saccharibacteria bacterium]|nr:nucleotide exchange factor GrpE [Candidatus Saccharibacteria bacterium]HIO87950.1 nucleotide exchange factor GrpE [Candidatus Saccharibacteria bacterium]